MGFPVGYTDIFIPTLFLHTLTFFRTLLSSLGLTAYLNPNPTHTHTHTHTHSTSPHSFHYSTPHPPLSAILTKELLPLLKLEETQNNNNNNNNNNNCCSVCLYDVNKEEEIRWLENCKHVFHKDCIDRWIDLDHATCPLCRTPFLRDDLLREFNQRLLLISSSADFHGYCDVHDDACSELVQVVDDHYNWNYSLS